MSNRHRKHYVKLLKWIDGILDINDHEFDTYEIAITYCKGVEFDSVKIYDEDGLLIYNGDFIDIDLYACYYY